MDILMGLVIAMFIITAVFVGYHASQEPVEVGGHNISTDLEILNQSHEVIEIILKHNMSKNII